MKRYLNFKTLLTGLVLLFVFNCKKGETGPQGEPGKDGAKVVSRTYSMNPWSYASPHYYINLNVPELTSANIDSSLVMVYFKTIGPDWLALPYTQYNSPINYYMGFASSAGNVQVTWFYNSSLSKGDDPNEYYGTTIECKVAIIPSASRKANVDHTNYEEVKSSYHLND